MANEVFAGIPDRKLRHFAAEARVLNAAVLSHVTASKRVALMATLLRSQVARALDDAAEMFVRLTTRMHNRAREALDEHRARQAAETDALVALLRQTVLACQDPEAKPDVRLSAIEDLLLPDADGPDMSVITVASSKGGPGKPRWRCSSRRQWQLRVSQYNYRCRSD